MPEISAFTSTYDEITKTLCNNVSVYNGDVSISARALWDTGASRTCISDDVANKLALIPTGRQTINTPSGSKIVNTYLVDIVLPNNVRIPELCVCGSDIGKQKLDVLIGMDIITQGDFAVSNCRGKTVFTFRVPSVERSDYAKQLSFKNTIGQKHGTGSKKKKRK